MHTGGTPTISPNISITVPRHPFQYRRHSENGETAGNTMRSMIDSSQLTYAMEGSDSPHTGGAALGVAPTQRRQRTLTLVRLWYPDDWNATVNNRARSSILLPPSGRTTVWDPAVMVSGQGRPLGFSMLEHLSARRLTNGDSSACDRPRCAVNLNSRTVFTRGRSGNSVVGGYSFNPRPLEDRTMWTVQEYTAHDSYGARGLNSSHRRRNDTLRPRRAGRRGGDQRGFNGTSVAGSGFEPPADLAPPALPFLT